MREQQFAAWLESRYRTPEGGRMQESARVARLSNCRRIETEFGDLDQHWRNDQLAQVIDLLTFSRHDAGPKHRIPIAGDGYTGTATLRAAARLYAQFCAAADGVRPDEPIIRPRSERRDHFERSLPRPLENIPTATILRDLSLALEELRARGVMRTANNPVADYAEYLVAKALDLQLLGNSTAGHDAVDAAGHRYEIKARRAKPGAASHQLSAIRKLEAMHFDTLVAVIFRSDFSVERAIAVPWDIVKREATFVPHTNAWNLIVRPSLWSDAAVRDLTSVVAAAL